MNTRAKFWVALVVLTIAALALAGCGKKDSPTDTTSKTPAPLKQVRGVIHLPSTLDRQLGILEHSGGVRTLETKKSVDDDAEIKSFALSQEAIIVYYRAEEDSDVVVRIERAPKLPETAPRVTGIVAKVTKAGALEVTTDEGKTYSFLAEGDTLDSFDAEHLTEHKSSRQPIIVYYEKPAKADQVTDLTYLGFDDAGAQLTGLPSP